MRGNDTMYTHSVYSGNITNVLYGTKTANTFNTTTLNCSNLTTTSIQVNKIQQPPNSACIG